MTECLPRGPGNFNHGSTIFFVLSVVALLACHNRCDLTVRCLQSLFAAVPTGVTLQVVLVDDGSTDGTSKAVASLGLPVEIVQGDGTWFWSQSMAVAEAVAEQSDPDWVLWINDDTVLSPDALLLWYMAAKQRPDGIVVGAFHSPCLNRLAYSGFDWPDRSSLLIVRLRAPNGTLQRTEGFHGNFAAVPRNARQRIGPVDGRWPHNYADVDYALRAGDAGVDIWLLPRTVGECDPDSPPWNDRRTPALARLRSIVGRKQLPVRAHWRLHRRHAVGMWPVRAWRPHWRALRGPRQRGAKPDPTSTKADAAGPAV